MHINYELSDYEVIQKCLGGDSDYFEVLVSRYKNLVFSMVLRMINDSTEAEDLAQEVFIKIYKNLEKYYPDYKFSTWVIRITTNHVIDYRRKQKQETISTDEVEFDIAGDESPENEYLHKEKRRKLSEVVGSLPDMYKIPIVLYHQQGLSYQEIADITDQPLSKVKNRIFRGRKMLKESILSMREGEIYGVL